MNNNRKLKIKKMMKKGATISLCAVLAGGIGVGAYEGVDYFTGAQSVQAATDSSEKLTLMKSDKKCREEYRRYNRYNRYKIFRYQGKS